MIKKAMFTVLAATTIAGAAHAVPSHITSDGRGGYYVTYDYRDKAKTGWYVSGRAEVAFLNFKNKYSSSRIGDDNYNGDVDAGSDKYSFEPVFGGNLAFGHHFGYFWRGEVEAGFLGGFSDKDDGFEYTMNVPYVMANGYYDFSNGIYLGAGLGIAIPKTELDGADFVAGDRTSWNLSPMAGLMLGYAHKLDDNLVLDIRYRLAGFGWMKQSRVLEDGYEFKTKTDLVMDNSISVGLRYEF